MAAAPPTRNFLLIQSIRDLINPSSRTRSANLNRLHGKERRSCWRNGRACLRRDGHLLQRYLFSITNHYRSRNRRRPAAPVPPQIFTSAPATPRLEGPAQCAGGGDTPITVNRDFLSISRQPRNINTFISQRQRPSGTVNRPIPTWISFLTCATTGTTCLRSTCCSIRSRHRSSSHITTRGCRPTLSGTGCPPSRRSFFEPVGTVSTTLPPDKPTVPANAPFIGLSHRKGPSKDHRAATRGSGWLSNLEGDWTWK